MSSSTAGTDRARALQKRSTEAATVSGVCGFLAALAWVALAAGGGGSAVWLAAGVALTSVAASFGAASYVLGSLAEVEPIR